jgi:hypothetical protein
MRIGAIGRLGRGDTDRVDAVHWHEAEARRIRAIEAQQQIRVSQFHKVLEELAEEERPRKLRVIEVVSAPGIPYPRKFYLR